MGGGLGGFISGAFGSTNDAEAHTHNVDPNGYQYGGQAGGAAAEQGRMSGLGQNAGNRAAPQAGYDGPNGANQSRGITSQGLGMLAAEANGNGPAAAAARAQAQQGIDAAAQLGRSQAAGARGPQALANAQYNAGVNSAASAAQTNSDASRAALMASSNAQNALVGASQQQQQLDAQRSQYNANLQMQSRAEGDQTQLGYEGLGTQVGLGQLAAQGNQQQQQSTNENNAQTINAQIGQNNANTNQGNAGGVIGAAGDVLGAIGGLFSDGDLKIDVDSLAPGSEDLKPGEGPGSPAKPGGGGIAGMLQSMGGKQGAGQAAQSGAGGFLKALGNYGKNVSKNAAPSTVAITSDKRAKEAAHAEGIEVGRKQAAEMAAADNKSLPFAPYTAGRQIAPYYPTIQTNQQVAPGAGPVAPSTSGRQEPAYYPTMQTGPTAPAQPAAMATPPGVQAMRVTSDENAKTGKAPVADAFLDALADSASTYRYKDPRHEPTSAPTGGRYLGVMAQRLEQVPDVGKQIVKDTPDGKKLEGGALMSALAAGLGRLQQKSRAGGR